MKILIFHLLAVTMVISCAPLERGPAYYPISQEQARLRWEQKSGDRLIADAYFSRDAQGRAGLLIGKEQTVLQLVDDRGQISARGRMAGLGWSGEMGRAPEPLADWAALLAAWQAADSLTGGSQELHAGLFRARYEKFGSQLSSLFVQVSSSGSSFTVEFLP